MTLKAKELELLEKGEQVHELKQGMETLRGAMNCINEKNKMINYLEKREDSTWQAPLAKSQIEMPSRP